MSLSLLREKIDKLDAAILKLIGKRLTLSKSIGLIKKKSRKVIEDKTRENEIVENIKHRANGLGLNGRQIVKIWKIIMHESKSAQKK